MQIKTGKCLNCGERIVLLFDTRVSGQRWFHWPEGEDASSQTVWCDPRDALLPSRSSDRIRNLNRTAREDFQNAT